MVPQRRRTCSATRPGASITDSHHVSVKIYLHHHHQTDLMSCSVWSGSSGWKLPARHPGCGLSPFPPCSDGDERLVLSGLGPVQDSPQRLTPGTGSACFPPAAGLGAAPSAERQSAARSFCMSGEQRRTGYIITQRPHSTQYRLTIQLNVR